MRPEPPAMDHTSHAPIVRRALQRLGVPAEHLDDAVQDVFTVVVRREGDFDHDRSLTNWLWGIARGVASTHRRALGRRARLHAALAIVGESAPTPDDVIARGEASARVAAFVDGLPTSLREVFVLAHLEGCSGPEIAARLEINLNTAYARIRTTRLRFEAALLPSEPSSIAARIMRAFAPLFAATSKSLATAGMTASLVWIGAGISRPAPTSIDTTSAPAPVVARTVAVPAKEAVMVHHTIATAALGAVLVAAPSVAAAAPAKAPRAAATSNDADADETARRPGGGQVSYYDFVDGDRLQGEVLHPEGANVDSRTRVKFPSLITLRGHFTPELVRLAKDL